MFPYCIPAENHKRLKNKSTAFYDCKGLFIIQYLPVDMLADAVDGHHTRRTNCPKIHKRKRGINIQLVFHYKCETLQEKDQRSESLLLSSCIRNKASPEIKSVLTNEFSLLEIFECRTKTKWRRSCQSLVPSECCNFQMEYL